MPRRADIDKILVLGAGPIVIGQGCEFDYSGVQACRALKEEGFEVVLVNSNPATIMTDPEIADKTYIEPLHLDFVARIIEKERPQALLPTMGGQTALNLTLELHRQKVLERFEVEIIGAKIEVIEKAEDRRLFKEVMEKAGLSTPDSAIAHSLSEAVLAVEKLGFPVIVRPSFTLGGTGGGIAYNKEELVVLCERGLEASVVGEILLDASLIGWKEFELEVVRDRKDNTIIVCSIENVDPLGIHTGDSITVAPALTLTDKEYQKMRDAALTVVREVGVETGGANVQFAVNPRDGRMVVIEMNPRVSRSSALASKATGFPIARVAAKLAVGFTLDELRNEITSGALPSSFEPAIDYVVTKIPRFAFEKLKGVDTTLTTQMKSVGEVMAIGRTFAESLQKAIRSLETGASGFEPRSTDAVHIQKELTEAGPERLWYVADAFRIGFSVEDVLRDTGIDPWFLQEIEALVREEERIVQSSPEDFSPEDWKEVKRLGFSDKRLASLFTLCEEEVRRLRFGAGVHPVYKRVDSCAAEFATATAYLYSTYEFECEARPTDRKKAMVLGSGPNRIGQGLEFDYCCVHAAMALRKAGMEAIMVNCNPETVSTDYDVSDRLYFEPLTLEDVIEISRVENPLGVICTYGGQTPLKLAKGLAADGVPILGTSFEAIDLAEDRGRFQGLLSKLGLLQPPSQVVQSEEEAMARAPLLGFPLLVRPSYVLGGRAMRICYDEEDLRTYLREAVKVAENAPILLDRFLEDAIEVDVDAVADGKRVLVGAVMEHIEEAGVHSGDSASSIPAFSLSQDIQETITRQTRLLAQALGVVGLLNVQFAIQGDKIYILEVNPRASRTIPFVSKATGIPLARLGVEAMLGEPLDLEEVPRKPRFWAVKESVFPFSRFPEADAFLGPEMKSTGEVMGVGATFYEAYLKSQVGAGVFVPAKGKAFISVRDADKIKVGEVARLLAQAGYELLATKGTAEALRAAGLAVDTVKKVSEGRPHIVDMIKNGEVALIVNTTDGKHAMEDSYAIRRAALAHQVAYYTTLPGGRAMALGLCHARGWEVRSLQELLQTR